MVAAALAATALAYPATAMAHGLVGRADLPIPVWLFGWAASIVLVVSFAALSVLWQEPRLQTVVRSALFPLSRVVDVVLGAFGIFVLVATVYCGFAGTSLATANLGPNVIYVYFWVGLAFASVLFGDVFRLLSPWRSIARAWSWCGRRALGRPLRAARSYPAWLGQWPAAAGIVGFAWLELVYVNRDVPSTLAWIVIGYTLIQLAGMAVFGIEDWSRRADAFGAYFGLLSLLALFERQDGRIYRRRPLSAVPQLVILPGTMALLFAALGSTTFDGFSNGTIWASLAPRLESAFSGLGASASLELAFSVGLIGCILIVAGFYQLGVRGILTVDVERSGSELARKFAHTLIPIVFAYVVAHYFSFLVFQGQGIAHLISDPLGNGSNIFGTAGATIDYQVIGPKAVWYIQVAALVVGHVSGLMLAHDRALALYPRVEDATRSQYWMLVVMVGFTSLGLWLLSAVAV